MKVMKSEVGFGNFTREELYAEVMPTKLRDFLEHLEDAYYKGYTQGSYDAQGDKPR